MTNLTCRIFAAADDHIYIKDDKVSNELNDATKAKT